MPYETCEALAPALLDKLLEHDLPEGVFLNVNFPNCPSEEVEDAVVTSQGKLVHGLWIDERADGRGLPYYWLRFGREAEDVRAGSDLHALQHRRMSVTPLKLDLTAHEVRDRAGEGAGMNARRATTARASPPSCCACAASGIVARELIAAFEATPRRGFVPAQWQGVAWAEGMIPIECGEAIEGADLQAR